MNDPEDDTGLDPASWEAFRARAHDMLDRAIDKMEGALEGRVWTPPDVELRAQLAAPLDDTGLAPAEVDARIARLLPHGVGNTHPRFFGWVHGAGAPSNLIAEIAGAALNANCGGRDHAAIAVERQVVDWCARVMGFPKETGGLVVSGTSLATLIALKVARDRALGPDARAGSVAGAKLVGYTSSQAHSCVARAFDMLGLSANSLRNVAVDGDFRMDLDALTRALAADRAAGCKPFCIIASAGTVNTGAVDDLAAIADLCAREGLWLHVDGAFGACAMLSDDLAPRLAGLERADSLAFDFHKWLHVNYDAGCVLVRDEAHLRASFSTRPAYLTGSARGLAAGDTWPVDLGPELSRGFRALKVWSHVLEHGRAKLGAQITKNVAQAQYLAGLVDAGPKLERLAPAPMQICCFRYVTANADLDKLNAEIVVYLQERGIAAPSTTMIGDALAIRVNITNHRTRRSDLDLLISEIVAAGDRLSAGAL